MDKRDYILDLKAKVSETERQLKNEEAKVKKEEDMTYDLTVQMSELDNKLSLVNDGVPVSMFYKPGMDVIHEIKLRKNIECITKNVSFDDIVERLVQDDILQKAHVQKITNKPADRDRMFDLIFHYLKGPKAYNSFRKALKGCYDYIVTALDTYVVVKDDIWVPKVDPADQINLVQLFGQFRAQLQGLERYVRKNQAYTDVEAEAEEEHKMREDYQRLLEETSILTDRLTQTLEEHQIKSAEDLPSQLEEKLSEMDKWKEMVEKQCETISRQSCTIEDHEKRMEQLEKHLSEQGQRQKDRLNEMEKRFSKDWGRIRQAAEVGTDVSSLLQSLEKAICEQQDIIQDLRKEIEQGLTYVEHDIERMLRELQAMRKVSDTSFFGVGNSMNITYLHVNMVKT